MQTDAERRILIVDDEPAVRAPLRRGLETAGYAVFEASGKAELFDCVARISINLITLDLQLADDDGLAIAQELRTKSNLPIIMITGRGAPADRLSGLEHGADDYIAKPFLMGEVLIRIAKVLSRYDRLSEADRRLGGAESSERYEFETGVADVLRRQLILSNGTVAELTEAEFDLLVIFLRRPTRILSRDELMMLFKGQNWSPLDRTIDGHIARLRKKIDQTDTAPRLIKSVRNIGYVFVGAVRPI